MGALKAAIINQAADEGESMKEIKSGRNFPRVWKENNSRISGQISKERPFVIVDVFSPTKLAIPSFRTA